MPYNPLARLQLPSAPDFPSAPAPGGVEPAGVPAFPAVPDELSPDASTAVAGPESPTTTIQAPVDFNLAAQIDRNLAPTAPAPLSDLDRYRLENDRELLRAIAYRRHFLHREE